jgi:hypothetical protein
MLMFGRLVKMRFFGPRGGWLPEAFEQALGKIAAEA